MTPVVLTIGALDPLGVDGIAADLRSLAALGVHGAIGVTMLAHPAEPATAAGLIRQIRAVREKLPIAAIKLGALGSAEHAYALVEALEGLEAPLVADPSITGLSHADAPSAATDPDSAPTGQSSANSNIAEAEDTELVTAWRDAVLPITTLVTANLAEAALLTGRQAATTRTEMLAQAEALIALGSAHAVVSGGHGSAATSTDIIAAANGAPMEMRAERLERGPMRGLSATLAAAAAAYIAHGNAPLQAAQMAKLFVSNAIAMAEHPGGSAAIRAPHQLARLWQLARDSNTARDS